MMQGLLPRGKVRRKHGTNVRVDGQKPNRRSPYRTSGQLTAKSIIHQGAMRRFGDCARKVTELTLGDLLRVASATEVAAGRFRASTHQRRDRRPGCINHGSRRAVAFKSLPTELDQLPFHLR